MPIVPQEKVSTARDFGRFIFHRTGTFIKELRVWQFYQAPILSEVVAAAFNFKSHDVKNIEGFQVTLTETSTAEGKGKLVIESKT